MAGEDDVRKIEAAIRRIGPKFKIRNPDLKKGEKRKQRIAIAIPSSNGNPPEIKVVLAGAIVVSEETRDIEDFLELFGLEDLR